MLCIRCSASFIGRSDRKFCSKSCANMASLARKLIESRPSVQLDAKYPEVVDIPLISMEDLIEEKAFRSEPEYFSDSQEHPSEAW